MGDVCTGTPTLTSFSASTTVSTFVSQSTSESISVGEASVVTRTVSSGTTWTVDESTIHGGTSTIQVEVPITLTTEQVVQVPVTTLFAPCTSEATSTTSSSVRTTRTTSDTPETTSTSAEATSNLATRTSSTTNRASQTSNNGATNSQNAATPTPTPTGQASVTESETGTLLTSVTSVVTTLPNGSQSVFVTSYTTSIPPNGSLNGNDNSGGGKSGTNTRAVAIGVGVTGGVLALIILIFGITWHIRRKRQNSLDGMEDGDIWGPGYESKTALATTPRSHVRAGSGYTYNPYAEAPVRYAPVPTGSPPISRPLSLADPMAGAGYPPPGPQPGSLGVTAPLLGRAKTADEILYEAARQDLPKSRTSSAAASHQTRLSETGLIHRPNGSLSASHMTHGSVSASHRTHPSVTASHMTHASESMKSRRSESVGGMLNAEPGAHTSLHHDAQLAQRYHDIMDAPPDLDRPTSPVSVVAPRLAIVNPDTDKD